jgi:hypothetical protein
VEQARQGYRDGLTAATQLAQASFLSQFPEIAAIGPESLPGALELMSRQDPARFARVKSLIATSEHLLARQANENRLQAELAHCDERTCHAWTMFFICSSVARVAAARDADGR